MRRLVIASVPCGGTELWAALLEEEGVCVSFEPLHQRESLVGRIYAGYVENVLKNLDAAFVRLDKTHKGYLPLKKEGAHRPGDLPLVQVLTDPSRGKPPRLTESLSLTGRFFVLNQKAGTIGISAKIVGAERERLRETASRLTDGFGESFGYGLIVRTQAVSAGEEELAAELNELKGRFDQILTFGTMRKAGSLLYQPDSPFRRVIADFLRQAGSSDEIIIEGDEMLRRCREEISDCRCLSRDGMPSPLPEESLAFVRQYRDPLLPLGSLYRFRKTIDEILNTRVWLKSGAYLMIEQTEAFVSIDVNTGKCLAGKEKQETFRRINLEAAAEIARQLRLRNLSGMILVDFIKMKREEERNELIQALDRYVRTDPVPCEVVDITGLGIVEMTRKKIRPPVRELLPGEERKTAGLLLTD